MPAVSEWSDFNHRHRAKRERWTQEIKNAKALAKREDSTSTVRPVEAVAKSMQQRGERHIERMAGVSERGVDHIETVDGPEILDSIDEIETLDKGARRTFGLSDSDSHGSNPVVNIALLELKPESIRVDQRDA